MAFSSLQYFSMAKISPEPSKSGSTVEILNWVVENSPPFARFGSYLRSQLGFPSNICQKRSHGSEIKLEVQADVDEGRLRRQDVVMVMERMGLGCSPEDGNLQEEWGSDDLLNVFDEEDPTLHEVKEAFSVFDENRDGFIDARELQRVLCALGFKQGSDLENCKRMIRAFDENEDDRIDFDEFVKFMENSFF